MSAKIYVPALGNYPTVNQPRILPLYTDANLATITAAGYLNSITNDKIYAGDIINAFFNGDTNGFFSVSIDSSGIITMVSLADPGSVSMVGSAVVGNFAVFNSTSGNIQDLGYLPSDASKTKVVMAGSAVVLNRIAHFVDTAGTIDDTAAAITNAGDIYAGLSGTAGVLRSYPGTATTGYLGLTGVANSGDFAVQIANASHGQASIHSLPDPGNAAARILVGATATPFTSGNFPVASGTGGLMVDSGLAAANIQNKTNIKAVRSADIGGAGAGPITITQAGITTSSIMAASIVSSTNTVSISKVTPGTGNFTILFSGDPGAACIINYVAFIAAQ